MTGSDPDWDWRFTESAEREYENLQPHERERIVSKLDEVVNDQWRDPEEYLEVESQMNDIDEALRVSLGLV
jgi:mRNA-degrading endonuclease RelE of RelBE toxin-antitoxin system